MAKHAHEPGAWWCHCGRWRADVDKFYQGVSVDDQHAKHVAEEEEKLKWS